MGRIGYALSYFKHYSHLNLWLRRPVYNSKIFCIGYNKTGTTSVGKSIEALGFRHSSFNKKVWRDFYANNNLEKILDYTAKFDSFDDLPWLKEDMIPVLDQKFPNSKFIYLQRDEESWQRSYKMWRLKLFGEHADMEQELANFRRHQAFIDDYFRDWSPDHFLRLDVKDPVGFKKLAIFLGKPPLQDGFPRLNETAALKHRKKKKADGKK
jgi:hypothetical protein